MREWFLRLFGLCQYEAKPDRVYFSLRGELIGVGVARHSDSPELVTLLIDWPGHTLEISWAPDSTRNLGKALYEAARDAQEGVPVERQG